MLTVVTLLALAVVGRIEYLRRCAAMHDRRTEEHILNLQRTNRLPRAEVETLLQFHGVFHNYLEHEIGDDFRRAYYHRVLSEEYLKASFRPWTIVNEPPPGWEDMTK